MAIYEPLESTSETRRYSLRSPVTLDPIGELECASTQEVQAAVDRARAAQPAWAAKSFEERAEYMHRMADLVIAEQDRVVETVLRETGKPRAEAPPLTPAAYAVLLDTAL